MIGAFRNSSSREREDFNICVAKCRVTNEHCIGVLKSRWYSLRELRTQLNQKKDSVRLVQWILLCAKLHNFVMDQNDFWTDEDATEENTVQEEHVPDEPQLQMPRNATRRDTTAASIALHAEVVAHAIAHHRSVGTFANLGRE